MFLGISTSGTKRGSLDMTCRVATTDGKPSTRPPRRVVKVRPVPGSICMSRAAPGATWCHMDEHRVNRRYSLIVGPEHCANVEVLVYA